jgi:predicted RNA-binding protein with PUA-like domain
MIPDRKYWLLKSEPETFSIDHLQKVRVEPWTGVRNFQARNFMRDQMTVGDVCFFYHSSCEVPGIVGLCEVSKINVVDKTQFDKKSEYFDPKSQEDNPKWICAEVKFLKKFGKVITLQELRKTKELQGMRLLESGSRLSVQPVSEKHFKYILNKFFPM